jgi:hypothetical protein
MLVAVFTELFNENAWHGSGCSTSLVYIYIFDTERRKTSYNEYKHAYNTYIYIAPAIMLLMCKRIKNAMQKTNFHIEMKTTQKQITEKGEYK